MSEAQQNIPQSETGANIKPTDKVKPSTPPLKQAIRTEPTLYRGEGVSNLMPDIENEFEEALAKQIEVRSGNQTETKSGKEGDIERYKGIIGEITSVIEKNWLQDDEVSGAFNGIEYKVRVPHLRRGKHAFVGIVELKNPDSTDFSCVVRSNPDDARRYINNPRPYGRGFN